MKRIIFILMIVLCSFVVYGGVEVNYTFGELQGVDNQTYYGNVEGVEGVENGALQFNESHVDYFRSERVLSNNNFTFEAWIRLDDITTNDLIFSLKNKVSTNGYTRAFINADLNLSMDYFDVNYSINSLYRRTICPLNLGVGVWSKIKIVMNQDTPLYYVNDTLITDCIVSVDNTVYSGVYDYYFSVGADYTGGTPSSFSIDNITTRNISGNIDYYSSCDELYDFSGNGYHLETSVSPTLTTDKGFYFDTIDSVNMTKSFEDNNFTLSIDFMTLQANVWNTPFSSEYNDGDYYGFYMQIRNNNNLSQIFGYTGSGTSSFGVSTSSVINPMQSYNYVASVNVSTVKNYLDGIDVSTSNYSQGDISYSTGNNKLSIGQRKLNYDRGLNGWVNDFVIYDEALTDKEVYALYDSSSPQIDYINYNGSNTLDGATVYDDIQLNISGTDEESLYSFNATLKDSGLVTQWSYYESNLGVTNYIYSGSTSGISGNYDNYSLIVRYCDGHTTKEIPDYDITEYNGMGVEVNDDLRIYSDEIDLLELTKDVDRYNFDIAPTDYKKFSIIVESDNNIVPVRNSAYTGHYVTGKYWFDFENEYYYISKAVEENYRVILFFDENNKDKEKPTKIKFKSIGETNCIEQTVNFEAINQSEVTTTTTTTSTTSTTTTTEETTTTTTTTTTPTSSTTTTTINGTTTSTLGGYAGSGETKTFSTIPEGVFMLFLALLWLALIKLSLDTRSKRGRRLGMLFLVQFGVGFVLGLQCLNYNRILGIIVIGASLGLMALSTE